MNWKAWTPLAVALVLGLLAARMAMNLQPSEAAAGPVNNLTSVIVAARDIEPGTTLTELDLAEGRVDPSTVPAGAFHNKAELVNRANRIALGKGQAIVPTLLADDGAGSGIAATLPKGMRMFTVAIDATSGVAGMIQPTCRVDVMTTTSADGAPKAKTILENVLVLTVGQRQNPNAPAAEPASTVTLLVSPADAEKLELATSTGRVRLLLRNGTDAVVRGPEPTTQPAPVAKGLEIPKGMRAYSMEIGDVSGVAGFIQPGSRVDIVTTETAAEKKKARTLLSNVRVLAVGARTVAGPNAAEAARTVTLLLKPSDVEKVELAVASAPLRLALRNRDDDAAPVLDNADAPAEGGKEWVVESIKGGASSKVTFELPRKK